jgi:hypothetical protein
VNPPARICRAAETISAISRGSSSENIATRRTQVGSRSTAPLLLRSGWGKNKSQMLTPSARAISETMRGPGMTWSFSTRDR